MVGCLTNTHTLYFTVLLHQGRVNPVTVFFFFFQVQPAGLKKIKKLPVGPSVKSMFVLLSFKSVKNVLSD